MSPDDMTRDGPVARTPSADTEPIQLLYRFPLRVTTSGVNSVLVSAVLWNEISHPLLAGWLTLVWAVVIARYVLAKQFSRQAPASEEMPKWARRFFIGSTLAGSLWGAATLVVWLTPDLTYHVFIAFVIAGMTAAAVTTSYSHPPSVYGFIIAAALSLSIAFFYQGGLLHFTMGIMVAVFVIFLMFHARISYEVLLKSLRLQDQNAMLIDDLSASRDELEQRVRGRTAELESTNVALMAEMHAHAETERRLRQAHRMEAVGQLTGGVAHDFNNLLAVILGNAELMKIGHGDDSESIAAIIRASDRGAELTQRLLAFSRKQPLRPRFLDVLSLVEAMIPLLDRTLGETIKVVIKEEANLWKAHADPGQVENVLLNLAINARDAMPAGGELSISCANVRLGTAEIADVPEATIGVYVVLSVGDTGTGISAKDLHYVFEPFFTTKEVGKGSGLGLSMVYGFAKQSGGHVTIASEVGTGTTVKLYLPRAGAADEDEELKFVAEEPRGRGERILVIEDDADLRALTSTILTERGYRVLEAREAKSARTVLENEQVDLLLSDIVLPGGTSGPELVSELKNRCRELKVIFMSGYPHPDTAPAGLLDDDVVLQKPFEKRRLAQAVREALDRKEPS